MSQATSHNRHMPYPSARRAGFSVQAAEGPPGRAVDSLRPSSSAPVVLRGGSAAWAGGRPAARHVHAAQRATLGARQHSATGVRRSLAMSAAALESTVGGRFLPFSVAMVTPFDEDGEFQPGCVAGIVSHLVSAGAPGLLISGSTGEQHCLSVEERCLLYKLARDAAGPAIKLYAGVAAVKTKFAVELAKSAQASQMDGIMLGFTPYSKISQRDGAAYAIAVAAAVPDTPIFLYNNSGRQPFNLEPSTFVQILQAAPNVSGVKEVIDDRVPQFRAAVRAAGLSQDLAYFSGSDGAVLAQFTAHQFNGLTSVVGQLYTAEMSQVVRKLREGDTDAAAAVWAEVAAGAALLAEGGSMLQSIKHVLRRRGVPAGHCCLPLQPLTAEQEAKLDAHFGLSRV
eukprot:COSAG03_NODE_9_length_23924_cov_40.675690_3_plen_397_part_00